MVVGAVENDFSTFSEEPETYVPMPFQLLLSIHAPITPYKTRASSGTINPPFLNINFTFTLESDFSIDQRS